MLNTDAVIDNLFWSKVKILPNGCWEWQGYKVTEGYGRVKRRKLKNDGSHRNIATHRYAYYLRHGKFPTDFACHTCDNPPCCNPDHLFDADNATNMKDMINKGRHSNGDPKGEKNPNSKLTSEQVTVIKTLLPTRTNVSIAKEYGVHHATISAIRVGKTW